MRIKDLKLGIRLGVAFAMLLMITLVIAALGVRSVTALQHSNEHIATSELKRQNIVHQWQTDIQMNWLRKSFHKTVVPQVVFAIHFKLAPSYRNRNTLKKSATTLHA